MVGRLIGVEISQLFHAKARTGIPRVIQRLVAHARGRDLVFFAGDRALPQDLARRFIDFPGDTDALARLRAAPPVRLVRGLERAVYTFWRHPRKLCAHEVSIVYDMIPLLFPEYYPGSALPELFREHVMQPMPYNDRVVCISQATQRDLARFTHVPSVAALLAADAVADAPPPLEPMRRFLCVGSLEPRKNIGSVIRWFLTSDRVRPTDELRIVAGDKWGPSFEKLVEQAGGNKDRLSRVTLIGAASDDELLQEYRRGYCLLYPSLYEGFGLPPLEAMAQGCPAVISRNGALPEVGGDAAVYVDDSLDAAVARVESEHEGLRQRGLAHARSFSWQRFADTVFDA